jgi:xanthine dehydrogenase accessory factor
MDRSTDIEVLSAAIDWLADGQKVYLATVAATWGSSPRQPGSMMAIHPDGRFVGSVSGGCIEDDLAQQAMKGELDSSPQDLPRVIEYGIGHSQVQRVGLPCGGRLQLVLESIESSSQLKTLMQGIEARKLVSRHVCMKTGEASLRAARNDQDFQFDGKNLVKVFGPGWRMLLVGAGELSRRVAQLAMSLDYAVTLCDSRPEYAASWLVEGTELVTQDTAAAIRSLSPDQRTVVLALSHAPSLDDKALAAALQSDAFYIGALGSLRNQQARLRRLRQIGLASDQLARLHGPVGLDIGSRAPAEIAISIMAALVAERNRSTRQSSTIETACV